MFFNRVFNSIYEICSGIHSDVTGGRENLDIKYETEVKSRDQFNEKLKEGFSQDVLKGYTSFGPHKDYLGIKINGKDIKNYFLNAVNAL